MRRTLLALITSVLLLSSSALSAATDWTGIAAKLRDSVVNIETNGDEGEGRCSGFVIDDARDFVMTAAHCLDREIFVNSEPADVKARDVKNDLAVLYVKDLDHDAVTLSRETPKVGEEVASYGFGWGLERPLFRVGHVSDNKTSFPGLEGGPWIVVDAAFIGGQSGCPIVNLKGEVVAIVQRTTDRSGIGVGADVIRDKMGKYFALK